MGKSHTRHPGPKLVPEPGEGRVGAAGNPYRPPYIPSKCMESALVRAAVRVDPVTVTESSERCTRDRGETPVTKRGQGEASLGWDQV